ncbi:Threonine--tRNA ligase [compost metagenome]
MEDKLRAGGIRVENDLRNEKLGYKIREAQLEKIPYMFVVGESEQNSGSVSVRKRGEGDLGAKPLDEVIALLTGDIQNHTI